MECSLNFQFYQFTLFAMSLNEMPPSKTVCPTDSRLRPDIRKLEVGDIDGAALEKTRLEEKQRDSRKAMKSKKEEWKPRYGSKKLITFRSKSLSITLFCFQ